MNQSVMTKFNVLTCGKWRVFRESATPHPKERGPKVPKPLGLLHARTRYEKQICVVSKLDEREKLQGLPRILHVHDGII